MNKSQLYLNYIEHSLLSTKGEIKMLSEAIVGLSIISSAISALGIEIYAAKKVSSINANLNHRNH